MCTIVRNHLAQTGNLMYIVLVLSAAHSVIGVGAEQRKIFKINTVPFCYRRLFQPEHLAPFFILRIQLGRLECSTTKS